MMSVDRFGNAPVAAVKDANIPALGPPLPLLLSIWRPGQTLVKWSVSLQGE